MQTDHLFAHSLWMWIQATVKLEHDGSGALRNLAVTTMPPMAHEEYFFFLSDD